MNAEIEQIKKHFHNHIMHAPRYNPFNYKAMQRWNEWAEGCRDFEKQLTKLGVEI